MKGYQRNICLQGRSSGSLLTVLAVIIMVLPNAEHEYTYRYVILAVALACMAAALAFRQPGDV